MILNNWLNPEYWSEEKIKKLHDSFLTNLPFPHLELPHFVNQKRIIKLLQSLTKEKFQSKQADLFQFSQTADLLHTNNKMIQEFISVWSSPKLIEYLKKITDLKISGKIDLFASIYQDTDFLLPHDDQIQGRMIAFMLYLNDLQEKDGGALAFYKCKNKNPYRISKMIIPKAGTLVFFEVSPLSFHRVEEVLTDTQRITLSGWFYG